LKSALSKYSFIPINEKYCPHMLAKSLIIAVSFATLFANAKKHTPNIAELHSEALKHTTKEHNVLHKRLYTIVFQGETITYSDKPSFVTSSEFRGVPHGYVSSPTSSSYHSAPSVMQAHNPSLSSHDGIPITHGISTDGFPTPFAANEISKQTVAYGSLASDQIGPVALGATSIYQAQEGLIPISKVGASAKPGATSSLTGSHVCTPDGTIVCIGPSQYGICNNGVAKVQQLARGTRCSNGQIYKS
jgi:hypothetical protein